MIFSLILYITPFLLPRCFLAMKRRIGDERSRMVFSLFVLSWKEPIPYPPLPASTDLSSVMGK